MFACSPVCTNFLTTRTPRPCYVLSLAEGNGDRPDAHLKIISIPLLSSPHLHSPSNSLLVTIWALFSLLIGTYFPGGTSGKEPTCQCRRHKILGFDPWRKISWRRKWQPTAAFLPGESHGQGSPASYSPWGHKESETPETV